MDYSIKEIVYENNVVSKLVITDLEDNIIFSYSDDLLNQQILEMRLQILGNENDSSKDSIFKLKLKQAKYIALDTLYPYNQEINEIPTRLAEDWQVRCAIELYNRMNSAGASSYSENGLSVSYFKGLLSSELMSELTPPKAGVPK